MSDDFVAALLEERRGYEQRGLVDRVAEVDAELAKVPASDGPPVIETPEDDLVLVETKVLKHKK